MRLQPIHKENWDYLIILDACRYDYFKEVYSQYFKGGLKKVKSRGSSTEEWLEKNFPDEYDYTYISSNPYINGKGVSLDDMMKGRKSRWNAINHFKEIIDVWDSNWNKKKGTVLPEEVSKTAKKHKTKKPLIIHYLQPHGPYITKKENKYFSFNLNEKAAGKKRNNKIKDSIWFLLATPFHQLPFRWQKKIKKLLGIYTKNDLERIEEEEGEKKLKGYYKKNLSAVMKSIQKMCKSLDGKVIITADHGENFGEGGIWGHQYESDNELLRTVPWFTVKGVKE